MACPGGALADRCRLRRTLKVAGPGVTTALEFMGLEQCGQARLSTANVLSNRSAQRYWPTVFGVGSLGDLSAGGAGWSTSAWLVWSRIRAT